MAKKSKLPTREYITGPKISGRKSNAASFSPSYDFLFEDPNFEYMNNNTKLLYNFLRKKLAKVERDQEEYNAGEGTRSYLDEEGNIYCIADNAELMQHLKVGKTALIEYKKELAAYGLLTEVPQKDRSNRMYVNEPAPEELAERWDRVGEVIKLRETLKKNNQKHYEKRVERKEKENTKKEPQTRAAIGTTGKRTYGKFGKRTYVQPENEHKVYINNKYKYKVFKINKKILKSFKPQQQKDNYISQGEKAAKQEILKTCNVPEIVALKIVDRLEEKKMLGQATNQNVMLGAIKAMEALKHQEIDVPHLFITKYIENEIGVAAIPRQKEVMELDLKEEQRYNPLEAFKEVMQD